MFRKSGSNLLILLMTMNSACGDEPSDKESKENASSDSASSDTTSPDAGVTVDAGFDTGFDTETSSEWDTYPEKNDSLAMTPPMGWNSWNYFKGNIRDSLIREIADAMVSTGMKDVGYEYINLDDQWMRYDNGGEGSRDEKGNLVPDPKRFPDGIVGLAEYVHSLGLKLGIYGNRGTMTCSNLEESGSYGYEERDAQNWADWGVDYLKYDNCNLVDGQDTPEATKADYQRMAAALKATGRPIVFSLCAWGWKGEWMIETGHLWRSTGDISDCWSNAVECSHRAEWENGIVDILDQNAETAQYAGPGHWNDPDMLEVGNGHLTDIEYKSHFSLWAIMAAPLIAGNDLRDMTPETLAILTNEEVIAVDQDPAGIQGRRIVDNGDLEVWMKPLKNPNSPEKAVVLFNRGETAAEMAVNFTDVGINGSAAVRDLWAKTDLGIHLDSFSASVDPHGVVMVKLIAQ